MVHNISTEADFPVSGMVRWKSEILLKFEYEKQLHKKSV